MNSGRTAGGPRLGPAGKACATGLSYSGYDAFGHLIRAKLGVGPSRRFVPEHDLLNREIEAGDHFLNDGRDRRGAQFHAQEGRRIAGIACGSTSPE